MSQALLAIDWVPFFVVMTLAYVIPGPDFVIILKSATRHWRHGVLAAVGAQTGLAVHMLLAAGGLSAILSRQPEVLDLIRVVGGLYLVYLGTRLLCSDGREHSDQHRAGHPFLAGLLTNLLNPKALLFFVSILPQFISPEHSIPVQVLVLGMVDVLYGLLPWVAVIVLGSRLGLLLAQPRRRKLWDRTTGCLLAGIGAWLTLPGVERLLPLAN
ncbi:LysE family translocator [Ornithinimicrobium pratense]|uniref:LysE family translocator n=1 Tax=Ornithinimicrobium pratense TaxID=2593973 RepID=UPI00192DB4CF|nr:LysE family translocator [Ornithinimicrobium pratense]